MVGDGRQFKNGRHLAVALGLTPRQHSSGGREKLLGISKRGDKYIRTLLIHGARSALRTAPGKTDRLSRCVVALAERSHPNVAATALAHKMARGCLGDAQKRNELRTGAHSGLNAVRPN